MNDGMKLWIDRQTWNERKEDDEEEEANREMPKVLCGMTYGVVLSYATMCNINLNVYAKIDGTCTIDSSRSTKLFPKQVLLNVSAIFMLSLYIGNYIFHCL